MPFFKKIAFIYLRYFDFNRYIGLIFLIAVPFLMGSNIYEFELWHKYFYQKPDKINDDSTKFEFSAPNWVSLGPVSEDFGSKKNMGLIGRFSQLFFHPRLTDMFFGVSPTGGVWVSRNQGKDWIQSSTDFLESGLRISCISNIEPYDSLLILGTGDPNLHFGGNGILISDNLGLSWKQIKGSLENRIIYKILSLPSKNNELIAATDSGIWVSKDFGKIWNLKTFINTEPYVDIEFKPGDPNTIYSCTHSNFYKSIDAGKSWINTRNGISIPENNGMGMRIATCDLTPDLVYVGVFAKGGILFKSSNSGNDFKQVYQDQYQRSLTSRSGHPNDDSNGEYNFDIEVDPSNPDRIYWGTQVLWKSEDGGLSWIKMYEYNHQVHPDIHDIEFYSKDKSNLFLATDGGVVKYLNDIGVWEQVIGKSSCIEIYNGAAHPLMNDRIYMGTQDNGSMLFDQNNWRQIEGGDKTSRYWFDYSNSGRIYSNTEACFNISGNLVNINLPDLYQGNCQFDFSRLDTNLAYYFGNELWVSNDLYKEKITWKKITDFGTLSNLGYIRSISISKLNPNDVLVLTPFSYFLVIRNSNFDLETLKINVPFQTNFSSSKISWVNDSIIYISSWNKIYRSADLGKSWVDVSFNLPFSNIQNMYFDPYTDDESVYLLTNNQIYYKTKEVGAWINYSEGLPTRPIISDISISNDGSRNSYIYAFTFGRGVFRALLNKKYYLPSAKYCVDKNLICPHQSVNVIDSSIDVETWEWIFDGGIPNYVVGKNVPPIFYPRSGKFDIKLICKNQYGIDSLVYKSLVKVLQLSPIPILEDFKVGFINENWIVRDNLKSKVVWGLVPIDANGGIGNSLYFSANHSNASCDLVITSPNYGCRNFSIKFDYFLAIKREISSRDSLQLLISFDCGATLIPLITLSDSSDATHSDFEHISELSFSESNWRQKQMVVETPTTFENVQFLLRGSGNRSADVILLDNIDISCSVTSELTEKATISFDIFPNPTKNEMYFSISKINNCSNQLLEIFDAHGILVKTISNVSNDGKLLKVEDMNLAQGVYYIRLTLCKQSIFKRLIIL